MTTNDPQPSTEARRTIAAMDDLFRTTEPVHTADDLAHDGIFDDGEIQGGVPHRPLRHAPRGHRLRMRRVIIDTDVSLSIKNRLPPNLLRELVGAQVGITFVTLGELVRWAHHAPLGCGTRAPTRSLAGIPPDAALYGRHCSGMGRHLRAHRAARAATTTERHLDCRLCLACALPLASMNVKDFTNFAEHKGLTLLTP